MTMTKSNHEARLKFWASVAKVQRSERASKMAHARWNKKTKAERSEMARQLVNIRWQKKLSTSNLLKE